MHESSLAQELVLEGEQKGVRESVLRVLEVRFKKEEADKFEKMYERSA